MRITQLLVAAMAAAGIPLAAQSALAQANYPDKPITVIVPFAAGGPTDTVARLVAQSMQTTLKQTVLIENVGGVEIVLSRAEFDALQLRVGEGVFVRARRARAFARP